MKKLLLLLLIGCDLEPPQKEISVQIESFAGRMEIMDVPWYTTHIIRGKVAGGEEGMKIRWYSDMYWDRTDSSGYLKMIQNRYISTLLTLPKKELLKGIKEINLKYKDNIKFNDKLTCVILQNA